MTPVQISQILAIQLQIKAILLECLSDDFLENY